MFLAGLEIDLQRIRGGPLRRALTGWGITFVAALALGAFVAIVDGEYAVQAGFLVGLAVTTTAFGILLPILHDSGELATQFGTEVLAGSAIGELGPIVALAVLFGTDAPGRTLLVLLAFVAVVILASLLAHRRTGAPPADRVCDADDERPGRHPPGDAVPRRHGVAGQRARARRAARRVRRRDRDQPVRQRRQPAQPRAVRVEAQRHRVRLRRARVLRRQRHEVRPRLDLRRPGDPARRTSVPRGLPRAARHPSGGHDPLDADSRSHRLRVLPRHPAATGRRDRHHRRRHQAPVPVDRRCARRRRDGVGPALPDDRGPPPSRPSAC